MRLHLNWKVNTDQVYVLNLDEEFCPLKNHQNIFNLSHKTLTFLGGEPHFQIVTDCNMIVADAPLFITQRYNCISDFFNIMLAVDAARRMGFDEISLILPYFPAARQDRVCNPGEPLTVKVFADMINSLNLKAVYILSPHSEVTPALLNNVIVHDELQYAKHIICDHQSHSVFNIVCPDAGAGKRVGKIVSYLAKEFPSFTFNLIRCEKDRDVRDGSLKEFIVQADHLSGYPTIIFDDIVAMGGTFLGLAEVLRKKGAGGLKIFTSHADCVAGLNKLAEVFDCVYTTNSKIKNDFTLSPKVEIFEFTL